MRICVFGSLHALFSNSFSINESEEMLSATYVSLDSVRAFGARIAEFDRELAAQKLARVSAPTRP
jgi:hypothetical protein